MIEQELQLLPDLTTSRDDARTNPQQKPEHTWESRVTNDDKEGAEQQWVDGSLKGDHRVRCDGEPEIGEHRCRREDGPIIRCEQRAQHR